MELHTCIDASYAVHDKMKCHIDDLFMLEVRIVHSKVAEQKLKVKRLPKAEIVSVSDYLPYLAWTVNFVKEQGYPMTKNVMYQENSSAGQMKTE